MSKARPLGCKRFPETFTAFHPLAVKTGEWNSEIPAQELGIPVCTGRFVGEGVPVMNVLVCELVGELEAEMRVVAGGASGTKFAATSLSKSVFFPCVRSSVQWPKDECTLKIEVFFAGWIGALLVRPCAKGDARLLEFNDTVLPSVSCHCEQPRQRTFNVQCVSLQPVPFRYVYSAPAYACGKLSPLAAVSRLIHGFPRYIQSHSR